MFPLLLALQLVLPLGLIGWLLMAPAQERLGFATQVAAIIALLVALSLAAIWLVPPWWMPYAFGALLMLAVVRVLRRPSRFRGTLPTGTGGRSIVIGFLVLAGVSGAVIVRALLGRRPPPGPVVDLSAPLDAGRYLVVSGGNALVINAHLKVLDPTIPRYRAWRGNAYALDLVAISRSGLRASGFRPADPAAYRTFGVAIVAPCAGKVVAAVDGLPDLRVPRTDVVNRAGNHVILRCAEADVVLAHFRSGSVQVRVGAVVTVGQPLGEAGNSGASDEPHLHIHAQRPGTVEAPMSGEPLPIRIDGRYLVRGQRLVVQPTESRPPRNRHTQG